jgi:hypothetical protein
MLFSWYAADFTTDPAFVTAPPEVRANPSMASWGDSGYLTQQQHRLPSHKYRRLHLNLPGLPEGSAFQPEPIMDAISRGVRLRRPERDITYTAFVDMSGGSSDDAVLAIGHSGLDGRAVVDLVQDQGAAVPFNPNKAVERFVHTLGDYRVAHITGDRYAGETFRAQFADRGIRYTVATDPKSALFEALEPIVNAGGLVLPDVPLLEQQLLGLVWRGGKIDHQHGEHDDFANAVAGVVRLLSAGRDLAKAAEVARWALSVGADEPRQWPVHLQMASDGCPRP